MQEKYFGTVVHGQGKGKNLGFPTINIRLINNELDIENGVYAVRVGICRDVARNVPTMYNGMLYVGTRPTYNMQETTIEIHIFDFNEDIYHRQISFHILHKIRHEIQFESTDKLIEQLHRDKETVYKYFQTDINL